MSSSPSSCLSEVKGTLSLSLESFARAIDFHALRFKRPRKTLFFCGGQTPTNGELGPVSVRDYLYRIRPLKKSILNCVVLAESANDLYRESRYNDLITFEEDIARISAVVLLIAESPGSLAELGAFSSIQSISSTLYVIMSESHYGHTSFIRHGPIERLKRANEDCVHAYPWDTRKSGPELARDIEPHYAAIEAFIENALKAVPTTLRYPAGRDERIFCIAYWLIFVAIGITFRVLCDAIRLFMDDITEKDVKNKLYSLRVAGWILVKYYGGKEYYYTKLHEDPFDYSFRAGERVRDGVRWRVALTTELSDKCGIEGHVQEFVMQERGIV